MKKYIKIIVLSLVILTFLFVDVIATADTFVAPGPSRIEIDDGNKVFFITPDGHESDEQLPTGLYYNTEPPELIYLVISDYGGHRISYFQEHNVFLSNDGMYFAHIPIPFHFDTINIDSPTAFSTTNQGVDAVAIEFYAKGEMIKQYTVSQLVERHSDLAQTVTTLIWQDWGLTEFGTEKNNIGNNY